MPPAPFQFTRRSEDGSKLRTDSLGKLLDAKDISKERWLFVSPHDDDACIGAGLWMQAAIQAGVEAYLLIITDGRMGYCLPEQRDTIIETRRVETYDSCAILGLDQGFIRYIDYADSGLFTLQGRRTALPGEEGIRGYEGLQNRITYHLRSIAPTRVIVPTPTDLHPDHRITHSELMISLFHASGKIWPELGTPIKVVPHVYEMAVYCDFPEPPNLQLQTDQNAFTKKLESIAAFQSQNQIEQLVNNIRSSGPVEYLREVKFLFYDPKKYKALFD